MEIEEAISSKKDVSDASADIVARRLLMNKHRELLSKFTIEGIKSEWHASNFLL